MSKLFISHASEDRVYADRLVDALEAKGVPCWIAPRDIRPSTSFPDEIAGAISSCRGLVLIFSAAAKKAADDKRRGHITRELTLASKYGRPIYPINLDGSEPSDDGLDYFLVQTQWISDIEYRGRVADALIASLNGATLPPPYRKRGSRLAGWEARTALAGLAVLGLAGGIWHFAREPQRPAPSPSPSPAPAAVVSPPSAAPAGVTPSQQQPAPALIILTQAQRSTGMARFIVGRWCVEEPIIRDGTHEFRWQDIGLEHRWQHSGLFRPLNLATGKAVQTRAAEDTGFVPVEILQLTERRIVFRSRVNVSYVESITDSSINFATMDIESDGRFVPRRGSGWVARRC